MSLLFLRRLDPAPVLIPVAATLFLAFVLGPARAEPVRSRPYPTFERSLPGPAVDAAHPPIWSGLYGGLVGGDAAGRLAPAGWEDVALEGPEVSALIGYSWQRDRLVWGVEGDLGWLGASGIRSYGGPVAIEAAPRALSSLRLRAGIAFDNLLVYATGGAAMALVDTTVTAVGGPTDGSDLAAGFVLGGGVEMQVSRGFGLRVEALHYALAGASVGMGGGSIPADLSTTTLRAGVTFRLD